VELWKSQKLKKHYEGSEIYELLYDVSEDKDLSFYKRNPDPEGILFQDVT